MNIQDLELNMNLKVVSIVPLKLEGECNTRVGYFTIQEFEQVYLVTGPYYEDAFSTLKQAIQECYIQWG